MKRRHLAEVLSVVFALIALASCMHTPSSDLDALVADLFASVDEAAIQSAIGAIIAADPDPLLVAQTLREGPSSFDPLEPGWQIHELVCQDGKTRIFHLFVPTSYDPAVPHTLLFSLHGSVNQSGYTIEEFMPRRSMWESTAEAEEFLVLMPHGDRDVVWWSENGRQYLFDLLHWAKRIVNINENRLFLAGFSDGAAGTYWMAFHDPTAWAGFIPIYGSVSSPEQGPYQCYPNNLRHRPILASNGMGESYVRVESSLQTQLLRHGILIQWALHQTEHNLWQTMPYERDRSAAFIAQTARNPFPTQIAWKTASTETGRCDWISIDTIAPGDANDIWEDLNLGWEREIFHFGAGLQYQGVEQGIEVAGVEPASIAHSLGLKQGDKLVLLDGQEIVSNIDVTDVMSRQLPGATLTAEIIRNGERLQRECVLPQIPVIYRRDLPTAAIGAQVSGNTISLQTQRVGSLRIFISSGMFDLSQPVRVINNAEDVFDDIVQPDLEFMLEQWRRDRDRTTIYEGFIEIAISQ